MAAELQHQITEVLDFLEIKDFAAIKQQFESLPAADIAEIFAELEVDQLLILFRLVALNRRAEVFSFLPFEYQEPLLENLSDLVVTAVINEMEPVARTGLLSELDVEIRERLVAKMTPVEKKMAMELLAYPEDSIGRIMTTEFLSLKNSMRGYEALEYIRWHVNYDDEALHHIFVVDEQGHYVGDVTLAKIIIHTTQNIEDLMNPPRMGLKAYSEDAEAVDHFRKYDHSIAPVIDDNNVMIGIVTGDDIFDVAEEEATEGVQQFGGQKALEDPYFATPIHVLLKKRGGWLCVLFIGGFLTSIAIKYYDGILNSLKYLVYFLPIIISSGGNSGTQTASIIIRGLAVKEMVIGDWPVVLRREFVSGIGLGLLLGAIGFLWVMIVGLEVAAALTVGASLVAVVVFGAVTGAMLPFIFKKMNLDPAVSSSPLIAVLVDVVGIVIYLSIATKFLAGV